MLFWHCGCTWLHSLEFLLVRERKASMPFWPLLLCLVALLIGVKFFYLHLATLARNRIIDCSKEFDWCFSLTHTLSRPALTSISQIASNKHCQLCPSGTANWSRVALAIPIIIATLLQSDRGQVKQALAANLLRAVMLWFKDKFTSHLRRSYDQPYILSHNRGRICQRHSNLT